MLRRHSPFPIALEEHLLVARQLSWVATLGTQTGIVPAKLAEETLVRDPSWNAVTHKGGVEVPDLTAAEGVHVRAGEASAAYPTDHIIVDPVEMLLAEGEVEVWLLHVQWHLHRKLKFQCQC